MGIGGTAGAPPRALVARMGLHEKLCHIGKHRDTGFGPFFWNRPWGQMRGSSDPRGQMGEGSSAPPPWDQMGRGAMLGLGRSEKSTKSYFKPFYDHSKTRISESSVLNAHKTRVYMT